jgi:hypothetical protein
MCLYELEQTASVIETDRSFKRNLLGESPCIIDERE